MTSQGQLAVTRVTFYRELNELISYKSHEDDAYVVIEPCKIFGTSNECLISHFHSVEMHIEHLLLWLYFIISCIHSSSPRRAFYLTLNNFE